MKILEQDTSQLPPAIWLPKVKAEGCFTSPVALHIHFLSFDFVDIATYTLSVITDNTRRILFTKSLNQSICHNDETILQVENLHAKIAICYKQDKPIAAYVGSMNFVKELDLIDLMIPVPDDRLDAIVKFYNTLFERAYEQCHKTS